MFGKCVICFVICVIVCGVEAREALLPRELTCLTYGGLCVQEGDCREGNIARIQGLCPTGPKEKRMECCHGLPISATGCRAQGGECFPPSYSCSATQTRADDCGDGEICCILVN